MRQYSKTKRSIRKRSFLLFELLISLALIVLCLFPLVKSQALMRREERKNLEQMQSEQLAQVAFCKLKEDLYENKAHTWDELMTQAEGIIADCTYIISLLEYTNKTEKEGLVVSIVFTIGDSEVQRSLYLERRNA